MMSNQKTTTFEIIKYHLIGTKKTQQYEYQKIYQTAFYRHNSHRNGGG